MTGEAAPIRGPRLRSTKAPHDRGRPAPRHQLSYFALARWPDNTTLDLYALQFARLRAANSLPGPHDLWIAAAALQFDIPLVTRNTGQFARIEGIQLEGY